MVVGRLGEDGILCRDWESEAVLGLRDPPGYILLSQFPVLSHTHTICFFLLLLVNKSVVNDTFSLILQSFPMSSIVISRTYQYRGVTIEKWKLTVTDSFIMRDSKSLGRKDEERHETTI